MRLTTYKRAARALVLAGLMTGVSSPALAAAQDTVAPAGGQGRATAEVGAAAVGPQEQTPPVEATTDPATAGVQGAALGRPVAAPVQGLPGAPAPEPEGAGDQGGLADIVVTAQRQNESVQRTPIAIAVIGGDTLQARGLSTVTEFATSVPAVTIKSDFGTVNPNIYIRGVGSTDFNANVTGAVGVYIDEVVQASPAGQLLQFFDTDRVEVLRGPQGTLYGRNTTAGAVNIVSRQPTEELKVNAFASYDRFNEVKLEAGIGGAILPGLLQVRVAGIQQTRDGNIRNRNTNPLSTAPNRLNDIDTRALRGQLRLTPSPNVDLLLNGHLARSDTTSYVFQHRGLLDPAQPVRPDGSDNFCADARLDRGECVDYYGYADRDGDPFAGDYSGPSVEKAKTWGTNLKAEFRFGGHSLTSITAYENVKRVTVLEVDESPNFAAVPYHNADYRQFTQELRLASPTEGGFRWQLGGFYFREDLDFNGEFEFAVPRKGGTGLAIAPRYDYDQDIESYAAFGQAYLDLTERVTLTAGLRYSSEERTIDYRSGLSLVPTTVPGYVGQPGYRAADPFKYQLAGSYGNGTIIPLITLNDATDDPLRTNRLKNNDVSWRLALDWQVTDEVLLFASNSRGNKAGGFNGSFQTSTSQNVPLEDERLTSYEVGIKSDLFGRRLRVNATAFYYDYKNLQTYILGSVPGVTTPAQSPVNVNARNYGGELEFLARPTSRLTASLTLAYLNTKVQSLGDGGVTPTVDVIGNRLPIAPEFSANGSLAYEIPLSSGKILLGTDFTYADAATSDITNTPRLATDSYFLLGARAAFRTEDERWEFAVYGRNILDETYKTFVANIDFLGFDRVRYGEQATYGASASFKF